MPHASTTVPWSDAMEKLARKRAGMRLGWLIHALVYVAVNLLLATLSYLAGRHGAIFPLLGWGLGLAIHAIVVWLALPGSGLYQRMLARERDRLQNPRRTWA